MQVLSIIYDFTKQFRVVITAIVALVSGIFFSGVYFADARHQSNEKMRSLETRLSNIEDQQTSIHESVVGINQATQNFRSNMNQIESTISNMGKGSTCDLVRVLDGNVTGKPRCPAGWYVRGLDQDYADGSWRTHLTHIECCPFVSR